MVRQDKNRKQDPLPSFAPPTNTTTCTYFEGPPVVTNDGEPLRPRWQIPDIDQHTFKYGFWMGNQIK